MDRREFVKAGVAVGALGAVAEPVALNADDRHYYELRFYDTRSDMSPARLRAFFESALVPALGRAGVAAVGAFYPEVGPTSQQLVLLLEHRSAADALALSGKLESDGVYVRALSSLESDALAPYVRYEARLMRA